MSSVADRSLRDFLASLASREPAPGGGAVAALHAAQAAALVAMVARYSDRGDDPDAVALAARIRADADGLLARATQLITDDMDAFGAVARAYGLPRDGDRAAVVRREAIAAASVGAAEPPLAVIAVAGEVLSLARELQPVANANVITDIAAAADATRAAASTARINVEINLGAVTDPEARTRLASALASVDEILAAADQLSARVRRSLLR